METPENNVYQIDFYRNTERINGVRLNLGSMALSELENVYDHCVRRETDAKTDRIMVQDYIETYSERHPGGGDVA